MPGFFHEQILLFRISKAAEPALNGDLREFKLKIFQRFPILESLKEKGIAILRKSASCRQTDAAAGAGDENFTLLNGSGILENEDVRIFRKVKKTETGASVRFRLVAAAA